MKKYFFPALSFIIVAIVIFLVIQTFRGSDTKKSYSSTSSSTQSFLRAWGKNDDGQRAAGHSDGWAVSGDIIEISAGKSHTLALLMNGSVLSWGSNSDGQLGRATSKQFDIEPALVPDLTDVVHISAKGNYSLALKKDGTVWSWGDNFTGALGSGDHLSHTAPAQVVGLSEVISISAGNKFALAIKEDATVWGWGGLCNEENRSKALDLLNKVGSKLTQIEGGYYDVNSTGEGTYDRGEDCLNENTIGIKSTTPYQLSPDLTGATEISVGYGHALILKKDGSVWSFGCNLYGQLGAKHFDNEKKNSEPRKITSLPKIVSISAGFRHSLALTTKGEIYTWGINASQDEKGNTFNAHTPVRLVFPGKFSVIRDGHDYSLAIDENGKLLAWGMDNFNFLESGEPKFHSTPTTLTPGPIYRDMVATGVAHILAITKE
ncbi:MAG: hypothetical protein V4697_00490 [Patescibacteria group bacterium]